MSELFNFTAHNRKSNIAFSEIENNINDRKVL